jgi:hypothetical protein
VGYQRGRDIINRVVACIDVYFDDNALLDGPFNARMAQRSSEEDSSTMVDMKRLWRNSR